MQSNVDDDNQIDRSWVSCFGRLRYLCEELHHFQNLVKKVESEISPSPQFLVGELLDIAERVESLSSALKADSEKSFGSSTCEP